MVKQLLILGDSFCHGVGTASVFKSPDNPQYAFGNHVANHLGLDYCNLAEPGITILRTVELGYNYLSKNKHLVDTVLIGWTRPNRLGLHSDTTMLQILPSYCLLGDSADDDVFVTYDNSVKFLTDKRNKDNLELLPKLHKLVVESDFFESQTGLSMAMIDCFRAWLDRENIKYLDFSVFGEGSRMNTKLPVSFNDVMFPDRHPTKEEQKQMADCLIEYL
jgi:hypothetical protein